MTWSKGFRDDLKWKQARAARKFLEENEVTYADLAEAAGMLDRAARYLVSDAHGNTPVTMTAADAEAAGTLMGLAYQIRPRKVEL
jgi:hypothetical protein